MGHRHTYLYNSAGVPQVATPVTSSPLQMEAPDWERGGGGRAFSGWQGDTSCHASEANCAITAHLSTSAYSVAFSSSSPHHHHHHHATLLNHRQEPSSLDGARRKPIELPSLVHRVSVHVAGCWQHTVHTCLPPLPYKYHCHCSPSWALQVETVLVREQHNRVHF